MKSLEVYMWSTCSISLDFLDLRECCEIFKIMFFSSFEIHGWNKQISAPQIKNIPKTIFRSHVNVLARIFSAPANGIYFAETLPAAPPVFFAACGGVFFSRCPTPGMHGVSPFFYPACYSLLKKISRKLFVKPDHHCSLRRRRKK